MFKFFICSDEINMIQLHTELYIIILLILLILILLYFQFNKEKKVDNRNELPKELKFNFSSKAKELKLLFKIFLISYKKIMLDKKPDSERRKDLEGIIYWYELYLTEKYLKSENIVIDENFLKTEIEKSKITIRDMYNYINKIS